MSEEEISKKALEFYDSLFTGFEIYNTRNPNEIFRLLDIITRNYEDDLKEKSLSLKRKENE